MGSIMDFFKQQPEVDLSSVKKDLKKQEDWLKQLHSYSRDLHRYTSSISESHIKHKKEIIEQINNISKWIEYLNTNHISLKQEINELKHSLRKSLRQDFEIYNRTIEEYISLKVAEIEKNRAELKGEILGEIEKSILKNIEKVKPLLENNEINVQKNNAELTNPEKDLLSLLFNESKPLTYDQIARKLNKSVNSIRVYMNTLKLKKPIIDEFTTPSGSKVFSIKNSEMVKTLFNLR